MQEDVRANEITTDYDAYIQLEYSKEEGLLSGEANDIEQTKDGKLWIGTYAGLFKFDGNRFKLFQDIPSIKSVNCLYVDEEGRLWVGTNDSGVTILINEHVMNVLEESEGLLSNSVKSIVCDTYGNYYIGTSEGISVVSLSSGVKVINSFDQIKNVMRMSADQNGNIVAVTDRGEIFYIKDGQLISAQNETETNSLYITAHFTNDDRLLVSTTDNYIQVYDTRTSSPRIIKTIKLNNIEHVNSFYVLDNNDIFICADTGVALIDKDYRVTKIETNNFNSSIDNMLVDYQGNIWFSSSRLGLLELCKSPFVELFKQVNQNAVVNSTIIWNGLLYCGTDEGLVIVDENNRSVVENQLSKLLKNVRIRCLKVDSKNNLWAATTGMGLYRISSNKTGELDITDFTEADGMPGMRFRNVYELSDGQIMAAGDYGVAVIKGNKVRKVYSANNGLKNEKSLCLLEYKNACYVGSDGGGIAKIVDDKVVEVIGKDDGLSSEVILRMVYDQYSDGVFIIASNGINYLSSEQEIKHLINFPYSNNYDIICDSNGACWIMSSAGIYSARVDDLLKDEKRDYTLINSERGFRSSLVANSWIGRNNDDLYLCCDDGAVRINMSQFDEETSSYRMIMNYVEIDGEKYEISRVDRFKMSSKMYGIVFEPEVLNYSMNDPYVSVFMRGYDKKPTVCLLSELDKFTYSNLKSGTYVFQISLLDRLDGNVVESVNYVIEKEIEMYQTWWFKSYVMLIACLVLVWITWFFTRTHTQKTLLKQEYELEYAKKQIKMGNETILSIARTVDAKDSNTSEHSFRVSEYSVAIARRLNFSDKECENLRQMALLHDIGKIGIPDAILNKPSKLTDEEYEIMKSHVIRGGEILKDFTIIDNVSVGALYHHEKYDGTGYCHGLKGEEIPIEARIIGIADAFDAMTANRVYRKQLDLDFVISELKRCSGSQFDPKLVDIMLSLIDEKIIDAENLYKKSKESR